MKTLKQSWHEGDISQITPSMQGPINDLARALLKNWSEKEMRNCWNDFKKIWNKFLKRNNKNAHSQKNLAIAIVKELYMLDGLTAFGNKWEHKFKEVIPPRIIHPTKPNKYLSENTITVEYILGTLFILDHAARGKIWDVLDMYSLLSDNQLHEIKINLAKEQGVSKHCKKIAALTRPSTLNLLILRVLKKNPKISAKKIAQELEAYKRKILRFDGYPPQVVIENIKDGCIITWLDKHKKVHNTYILDNAFEKRISKLKDLL